MENSKIPTGFSSDAKNEPRRVVFVTKKTSAKVVGEPGPQLMTYPHLLIRGPGISDSGDRHGRRRAFLGRASRTTCESAPYAQSGQGAVVLSRPAGIAALLSAVCGRHLDSHACRCRTHRDSLLPREHCGPRDLGAPPCATPASHIARHRRSAGVPCDIPRLDDFRSVGTRRHASRFVLHGTACRERILSRFSDEAALLVDHDVVHRGCDLPDGSGHVFPGAGVVLGLAVGEPCRLKTWESWRTARAWPSRYAASSLSRYWRFRRSRTIGGSGSSINARIFVSRNPVRTPSA